MNISGIKLRIASKKAVSRSKERVNSEEEVFVESVVVILDTVETEVIECFREVKEFLHLKDEDFKLVFSVASRFRKQDFEGVFFDPADISWSGNFRGALKEIGERKFDLLICYTKKGNKPALFLSEVLDAGLKVSRQNAENAVFDLSISTGPEETEVFTEELKKYLRILNRIKE